MEREVKRRGAALDNDDQSGDSCAGELNRRVACEALVVRKTGNREVTRVSCCRE